MTTYLLLALVSLSGIGIYLTRHTHQPILTLKRDGHGDPVRPAVIVWVCADCLCEISETSMGDTPSEKAA